jgi:hypothetical protein
VKRQCGSQGATLISKHKLCNFTGAALAAVLQQMMKKHEVVKKI